MWFASSSQGGQTRWHAGFRRKGEFSSILEAAGISADAVQRATGAEEVASRSCSPKLRNPDVRLRKLRDLFASGLAMQRRRAVQNILLRPGHPNYMKNDGNPTFVTFATSVPKNCQGLKAPSRKCFYFPRSGPGKTCARLPSHGGQALHLLDACPAPSVCRQRSGSARLQAYGKARSLPGFEPKHR